MRITTSQENHPTTGSPRIVAKGMGKQRTTPYDHGISHDANHGVAAANLIFHVSSKMHPLTQQNGDHLPTAVVRSLDAGHGIHHAEGGKHIFLL